MLTITTDSAFGIRCRSTIRVRFAPITVAAGTKSRSRSVSTSPRTRRAGTSQEKRPMIRRDVEHGPAVLGREHEHDEQVRDRQQDVDEPHHHAVDEPGRQTRDRTPQGADHRRDRRREEADLERRLAAQHDPAELVEAVVVGPEQVRAARRQVGGQRVDDGLVGVVDERPDEAEQDEEHEHRARRRARGGCRRTRAARAASRWRRRGPRRPPRPAHLGDPRRRKMIERLDWGPLVKWIS